MKSHGLFFLLPSHIYILVKIVLSQHALSVNFYRQLYIFLNYVMNFYQIVNANLSCEWLGLPTSLVMGKVSSHVIVKVVVSLNYEHCGCNLLFNARLNFCIVSRH